MKVSVIIPAWGETPFIAATLSALERQTFRDFEIVRCEPPADSQNAGSARNVGLSRATGDWVWFLDADDLPNLELLAESVTAGERFDSDIVVFRADELDAQTGVRSPMQYLRRIVPYADGRLHQLNELGDARFTTLGLAPWNKLVRRSLLERQGIRFQSLPRSNDVAFTVELLAKARTFVALDRSLIAYRVNNSLSLQHTNAASPMVFLDALDEVERRLAGECRAAFGVLRDETIRYHLHSVRTLQSYRELSDRLGRMRGLKGSCSFAFRICRDWETLRDCGIGFCLRRLRGRMVRG